MARVNYTEAAKRFSHIDAEFVSCAFHLPGSDAAFTLKFYPWWEHPLFIQAHKAGEDWGFNDISDEGSRQVKVFPRGLRQIHISTSVQVITDWMFTQDHPLLWQYEQTGRVFSNAPLSPRLILEAAQSAAKNAGDRAYVCDVCEYLNYDNILRFAERGSFMIGEFPRPLFLAFTQELQERGIDYSAPQQPSPVQLPVLFLLYGNEYIIADGFEVDIPDFIHKPEWFVPSRQQKSRAGDDPGGL